ncbi:MAG: RtcB family protein [Pirellulaceae bacterium]|nr:RtcB family protein [Pirellulaceae bacterium]
MNARQLEKLGIPLYCVNDAIAAIQKVVQSEHPRNREIKQSIKRVVAAPQEFLTDEVWGTLACSLIEDRTLPAREPVAYPTWGTDIDPAAHGQMRQACSLPMAVAAALMPDAHVGYGLPIGGVLATEGSVIPYAVGVDIACRMKLSVFDIDPKLLDKSPSRFEDVLGRATRFGIGSTHETPQDHPVMDQDWNVTRTTREKKDVARKQLGTSGSGNHFVEFGTLEIADRDEALGLDAGTYTAVLSHSGSRGTGASVCSVYSGIARARLPRKYTDAFGYLAWLELESEAGQEYWAAMSLMGDYAAANHDVIHRLVSKFLGARIIAGVENHHNFAWKEIHQGRELIVHRKGATPAGQGQMGIIPGSMATPGFVVRGRGNPQSLNSASHGAGRCMSRTAGRNKFRWKAVRNDLLEKGIRVLSAGADEAPGVYKDIHQVMAAQTDLVDVIAQFNPKIVKMCDDNSRAED